MKKIIEHLKQNWIKYGFESLAVLISILAAFALSNWNETRKERKNEIYILEEIRSNLLEDSVLMSEINDRREKARLSVMRLLKSLEKGKLDESSYESDLAKFLAFERYYPIRNGFEMLKSNGMKISNIALRTNVSRYYDFEQNKVNSSIEDIERSFILIMQAQETTMRRHFNSMELGKRVIVKDPNDPDFLAELLYQLVAFKDNNLGTLDKVKNFQKINSQLIQMVTQEIELLT